MPNKSRDAPRVDDRRVLSGIVFRLQRGCRRFRWSGANTVRPKTLYNRYKRRSETGVFERICDALAREGTNPDTLMIDAGHIETHRIAAMASKNKGDGRAVGKTEGGLNPKPHPVCDGQGRPVHCYLTAGNRADIAQARQCLEPYVRKGANCDRSYDAQSPMRSASGKPRPGPTAQEPQDTLRIRHRTLQNRKHRRAHVQPHRRPAAPLPAHGAMPENIPASRTHRSNRHTVPMSLHP